MNEKATNVQKRTAKGLLKAWITIIQTHLRKYKEVELPL